MKNHTSAYEYEEADISEEALLSVQVDFGSAEGSQSPRSHSSQRLLHTSQGTGEASNARLPATSISQRLMSILRTVSLQGRLAGDESHARQGPLHNCSVSRRRPEHQRHHTPARRPKASDAHAPATVPHVCAICCPRCSKIFSIKHEGEPETFRGETLLLRNTLVVMVTCFVVSSIAFVVFASSYNAASSQESHAPGEYAAGHIIIPVLWNGSSGINSTQHSLAAQADWANVSAWEAEAQQYMDTAQDDANSTLHDHSHQPRNTT
jgi:hypothetical protein